MNFLTMLPEEQKIQEKKLLRWNFWFLVTLSLLLVLLFVYYLPARFQHQSTEHDNEMMMEDELREHDDEGTAPHEHE